MSRHRPIVAKRVAEARLSAIKEMAILGARDPDTASLTWGVPSFPTPEHIRAAVHRALAEDPDVGKYTLPAGLPELRRLAAERHGEKTGVAIDPESEVLVTAGNMQGVTSLLRTLVEPGDDVVMTDPGFASHLLQIRLAGGNAVYWALDEDQGWSLRIDALRELVSPRTKAVLLVSPSNPTGTIFSEADLRRLAALAEELDFVVILDDPYSEIFYGEETEVFNLASDALHRERIAYLFTFSKIHAMSGWRVGYMVVPEWLQREVLKVHDANMICAPRISQVAAIAALEGNEDHVAEFRQAFARRCALICERLDRQAHVFEYVEPAGAYYVFPRIVAEHEDSREFCLRVLEHAHVTLTPGGAFGPNGEHHVRMAFCVDDSVIETAFDRLDRYFGV